MSSVNDTILAVATPPGRGGIGVIRISGSLSTKIAETISGPLPQPRYAAFRRFRDRQGQVIDEGLVLYFPAPHSFTGDDVVELHGHGGPVVMDALLARGCELGARLARPGEFSERAFLNGKLDLAQAEALADLIACTTLSAARAALRSLQGEFSQRIRELVKELTQLRVYIEAAIDFPEEEIDFLDDDRLGQCLHALQGRLRVVHDLASQGCVLREGMTVVIAGRPNVGKSSLLNRLVGQEVAIVTDVPGTTRDVVRGTLSIEGMPLQVIDTAGLRESSDVDVVEQEGIRRAWAEMEAADRILLVVDDQCGITAVDQALWERLPATVGVTLVYNKIDVTGRVPTLETVGKVPKIGVSAKTGAGFELLRAHLKHCMGYQGGEGTLMARRRHVVALAEAAAALVRAEEHLAQTRAGELVAEELRLAQNALGEITGEVTSADLLEQIFRSFCIGK